LLFIEQCIRRSFKFFDAHLCYAIEPLQLRNVFEKHFLPEKRCKKFFARKELQNIFCPKSAALRLKARLQQNRAGARNKKKKKKKKKKTTKKKTVRAHEIFVRAHEIKADILISK